MSLQYKEQCLVAFDSYHYLNPSQIPMLKTTVRLGERALSGGKKEKKSNCTRHPFARALLSHGTGCAWRRDNLQVPLSSLLPIKPPFLFLALKVLVAADQCNYCSGLAEHTLPDMARLSFERTSCDRGHHSHHFPAKRNVEHGSHMQLLV